MKCPGSHQLLLPGYIVDGDSGRFIARCPVCKQVVGVFVTEHGTVVEEHEEK